MSKIFLDSVAVRDSQVLHKLSKNYSLAAKEENFKAINRAFSQRVYAYVRLLISTWMSLENSWCCGNKSRASKLSRTFARLMGN